MTVKKNTPIAGLRSYWLNIFFCISDSISSSPLISTMVKKKISRLSKWFPWFRNRLVIYDYFFLSLTFTLIGDYRYVLDTINHIRVIMSKHEREQKWFAVKCTLSCVYTASKFPGDQRSFLFYVFVSQIWEGHHSAALWQVSHSVTAISSKSTAIT